MSSMSSTQFLHPLQSYSFGKKDATADKDTTLKARLSRHRKKEETEGMRRTVEGVLLVHDNKTPYILLLQDGSEFRLPGGHLRSGEDEGEGLKRKLTSCLSPVLAGADAINWEVGELLATWWRPQFEPPEFPYLPAHCTKPKECRKIFMVPLPEKAKFAIPRNRKLMAVPIYELHNASATFGQFLASIPHLISRFTFTLIYPAKAIKDEQPFSTSAPVNNDMEALQSGAAGGESMAVDAQGEDTGNGTDEAPAVATETPAEEDATVAMVD